jgi:hypothetical protein
LAVIIPLQFCVVEWTQWGCVTRFADGAEAPSAPHDTPHYHVIAHRLGYGDETLAFCREHDFAHSFVEERLHGRASRVLVAAARGKPLTGPESAYEELAAQAMQAWLRANQRPIISGVNWDRLKAEALELLLAERIVRL